MSGLATAAMLRYLLEASCGWSRWKQPSADMHQVLLTWTWPENHPAQPLVLLPQTPYEDVPTLASPITPLPLAPRAFPVTPATEPSPAVLTPYTPQPFWLDPYTPYPLVD